VTSWPLLLFSLILSLQAFLVSRFDKRVQRRRAEKERWQKTQKSHWPAAEVILCIRGADPTLHEMLKALSHQNYLGDWRLQIVVDSTSDPSWRVIEGLTTSTSTIHSYSPTWKEMNFQPLIETPKQGSLKCASLLQAFKYLHPSSEIIAVVDADAVVKADWLGSLVEACCQPGIGAVSGNRWFIPSKGTLLGWTRAVWNAGAVVLMTLLDIPWGGSLAVRREVVDEGTWRALLSHGLCEDTGLLGPLKRLGLRYQFRPELFIVDHHDEVTLPQLSSWITRQLLTARLHHPTWPLVALHGIGSTTLLLAGLIKGAWTALTIYEIGCVGLLIWIERIAMEREALSIQWWAIALIPGQLLNGFATIAASVVKTVEWRDVVYRVTKRPRGVAIISSPTLNVSELTSTDSNSYG